MDGDGDRGALMVLKEKIVATRLAASMSALCPTLRERLNRRQLEDLRPHVQSREHVHMVMGIFKYKVSRAM